MPRPSMQMSFRAFGTNLTNALVDLFARPYNKPLTVPAFGVWAAFFAYILVTGIITLLVFMRFLTASPCIDQTMTLHELSKAYPNFDKCTFQYGTTNNPARSAIGMVEGAGFTITYTFVNPTEAANRNRPKVQPTLLPFYLNQTCSISHASSFSISQVIASVSPAGFDVVYPWARCGNADIYAQLTLRTNMNLKLRLYTAVRSLYLDTLYNGGFDRYAGNSRRTFLSVLHSTLNMNIPTARSSAHYSTAAYVQYQNGTSPRPYEQWYPPSPTDPPLEETPIVAKFLHDASYSFLQKMSMDTSIDANLTASASSSNSTNTTVPVVTLTPDQRLLAIVEHEITTVLVNGSLYTCQVCGTRDALNSFFGAAPWAHLLGTVIFFFFSKALQVLDTTPVEELEEGGNTSSRSASSKKQSQGRGGYTRIGG